MVVYGIIMFVTAVIFGVVAVMIYRGRTDLIHDYHQKNVKDKAGYSKSFGKAMAVMVVAMVISGVISLFGELFMKFALAVLILGLIAGIGGILRVQKKYNGGVF